MIQCVEKLGKQLYIFNNKDLPLSCIGSFVK